MAKPLVDGKNRSAPAFQFYARDEYTDTAHLALAELGAHVRGLMVSWDTGPLPLDSSRRRRVMGVEETEWPAIWTALAGRFWLETPAGWINPRLEGQRQAHEDFRRKQRENGRQGGRPSGKPNRNPDESQTKPSHDPDESSPYSDLPTPISTSDLPDPKDQRRDGAGAPLDARPEDLMKLWNEKADESLRRCGKLTDRRRRLASARLQGRSLDGWREIIERINRSQFCRGEIGRGWKADFDWLLAPGNAEKVLEGKYDDRVTVSRSTVPNAEDSRRFLDEAFGRCSRSTTPALN